MGRETDAARGQEKGYEGLRFGSVGPEVLTREWVDGVTPHWEDGGQGGPTEGSQGEDVLREEALTTGTAKTLCLGEGQTDNQVERTVWDPRDWSGQMPPNHWQLGQYNPGATSSNAMPEYWGWWHKHLEERYEAIRKLQKIEAIEHYYRSRGWDGNNLVPGQTGPIATTKIRTHLQAVFYSFSIRYTNLQTRVPGL